MLKEFVLIEPCLESSSDNRLAAVTNPADPEVCKASLAIPGLRSRLTDILNIVSWLYALMMMSLCIALYCLADRWWPATLIMFGPRWIWLLPLAILVPTVVLARRHLLRLMAFTLILGLGPLMGFSLPRPALLANNRAAMNLRLLTCNVHHQYLDAPAFLALVEDVQPDIVVLQECSSRNQKAIFGPGNWHVDTADGFVLASRFPIQHREQLVHESLNTRIAGAYRFDVLTPGGTVHIFNVHLQSPRHGLEAVIDGYWQGADQLQANSDLRWRQSSALREWADQVSGPVLLAGDFNTPVESSIYRRYWSMYRNAFSTSGIGIGNTHVTRRTGVRIDHILADPGWAFRRCWLGPDVGSAHLPVIADLYRLE
jgi:endonuclease/exonuclease/phosphatase (EEP) superfamily protein YafD